MELDVGTVLARKYELRRLLGRGTMGQVWAARHLSLGGEFAVKVLHPSEVGATPFSVERFQYEAQVASKLSRRTRHIVSVTDHGEEDGTPYLVMELLEGETLEHRHRRSPRLTVEEAAAIVAQVGRALGKAHDEGLVHRDLKPANVFLARDEDGGLLAKILDFGIARAAGTHRSPFATGEGMVLGTPAYMSPEQARGLDGLDRQCDLWALATITYELVVGVLPWEGNSVQDVFLNVCMRRYARATEIAPSLPASVDGFFAQAFAEAPTARFGSADELVQALRVALGPDLLPTSFTGSGPFVPEPRSSAPSFDAIRIVPPRAPSSGAPLTGPALAGRRPSDLDEGPPPTLPTVLTPVGRRRSRAGLLVGVSVGVVAALAILAFVAREPPAATGASPAPAPPGSSASSAASAPPAAPEGVAASPTPPEPPPPTEASGARPDVPPTRPPVGGARMAGPRATTPPPAAVPPAPAGAPRVPSVPSARPGDRSEVF